MPNPYCKLWHFIYVTWLLLTPKPYLCDLTHSCVRFACFVCLTWRKSWHDASLPVSYVWVMSDIFASFVWFACFVCLTWHTTSDTHLCVRLISVSYVWHDIPCLTWDIVCHVYTHDSLTHKWVSDDVWHDIRHSDIRCLTWHTTSDTHLCVRLIAVSYVWHDPVSYVWHGIRNVCRVSCVWHDARMFDMIHPRV